jgi:hypothetical protein
MAPYGNLSLGEIVEAAERRAASGVKTHPGFDFASLAPSPLKIAKHEAQLAEISAPAPIAKPAAPGIARPAEEIEGDLDNAWARLKRTINPDPPNRI